MSERWRRLVDGVDRATGWIEALSRAGASVHGGARWRYVWGAVFVALLLTEAVTGVAMMTVYSPSTQSAWASTWFLQDITPWGAVVRGVHHFASHALVIVLVPFAISILYEGSHRLPRAVLWWAFLALAGLTLAMNITGFPLAWDQRGYWASRVETGIIGSVPFVGPWLRSILLGGPRYGSLALSRFFALHTVILPVLFLVVLRLRQVALRRNGYGHGESVEPWWPSQAVRDTVACVMVVSIVTYLGWKFGAPLDAPADPQVRYHAEPEWYFAPLSQLLREVPATKQLWATVIAPGVLVAWLFALPFTDAPGRRKVLRVAVYLPLIFVGAGAVWLGHRLDKTHAERDYIRHKAVEARRAVRARALARQGIPIEGPAEMVRNDPAVRPRELFVQHCASCHAVEGLGRERGGPRLDGFGSRGWAAAVVTWPRHPELFGTTEIDAMPSQLRRLGEDGVRAVSEWLYAQGVEEGDPPADAALVATGSELYHRRCTICHQGTGDTTETVCSERDAPDLDGWGSTAWIRSQLTEPASPRNYGMRNHMPSFAGKLTAADLERVVAFTRALRERPAPAVLSPPQRVDAGQAQQTGADADAGVRATGD